jgi:hypothetical protein
MVIKFSPGFRFAPDDCDKDPEKPKTGKYNVL